MDEYNSGMDPEVKKYFIKIVNSFSIGLIWLITIMTLGIYFRLALFTDHVHWYNILYYIFGLISLFALLKYYNRVWNDKNIPR